MSVLEVLGLTLIKNIKIERVVGSFAAAIHHFFKFLNLLSFNLKLFLQMLQGVRIGVTLDQ